MIQDIMQRGFSALAAYIYLFALVSFGLYVVAAVSNAFVKNCRFNLEEIRKLFISNLAFVSAFALLDYFLI